MGTDLDPSSAHRDHETYDNDHDHADDDRYACASVAVSKMPEMIEKTHRGLPA
jgi:hypothetical protein